MLKVDILQEIFIPKETVNDDYVTVNKLYFGNGDFVRSGDTIVEFETSKVNVFLDAEQDGYIYYLFNEGSEVEVGQVFARIYDEIGGKEIYDDCYNEELENKDSLIETEYSKAALELIEKERISRMLFSGRDLVNIDDVREVLNEKNGCELDLEPDDSQNVQNKEIYYKSISPIKKTEINNLIKGGNFCSCVSVFVDIENLGNKSLRKYIPYTIIFEITKLLKKYPEFNAYYSQDKIAYYKNVNIGLAMDIDTGLKVINLGDLENKEMEEIESAVFNSVRKYMTGKLVLSDLKGATFTITDLSSEGIMSFVPLIVSYQSSILGICSIDEKLKRFTLVLSFDHRVTEGRKAGIFLRELKDAVECNFKTLAVP